MWGLNPGLGSLAGKPLPVATEAMMQRPAGGLQAEPAQSLSLFPFSYIHDLSILKPVQDT